MKSMLSIIFSVILVKTESQLSEIELSNAYCNISCCYVSIASDNVHSSIMKPLLSRQYCEIHYVLFVICGPSNIAHHALQVAASCYASMFSDGNVVFIYIDIVINMMFLPVFLGLFVSCTDNSIVICILYQ
jgi:hypothetical protein